MKYLPQEWERRVWTLGGGPIAEVITEQGQRFGVSPRKARMDVRQAADLWRLLWERRPDVVRSWNWMSSAAALALYRVLRIPVIDVTIRVDFVEPHRAAMRRLCMRLSAQVVANSMAGLVAWGIPRAKGRVLFNGFDPEPLAVRPCRFRPRSAPADCRGR